MRSRLASLRRLAGRIVLGGALAGLIAGAMLRAEAPPEQPANAQDLEFFEKEVAPLLKANCLKCHAGEKIKGGLRLTSRASILKGGDTGPAVDLEDREGSLLLDAINYRNGLEMPPSGKLSAEQIAVLTKWVERGLPMKALPDEAPAEEPKGGVVTEEARRYWAYQPVRRPQPPSVQRSDWVVNPVDAFILARLEAAGLAPNPPAQRIELVRRVYYDLTGLPPTPEEVDRFLQDDSPNAYEQLIDRLLESPAYGEKWGRHWLDLVHFAETNGYERDGPKPFAWRYRDYVIRSFNADKPYDQFIREQLAGDELPEWSADAIIATGYYRLGLWDDEPVDLLQARYDELDDIVATTGQVFLGMTLNCARCHDHKRDPIPQSDYYRLLAFFQDIERFSDTRDVSSRFNLRDISPPDVRAKYEGELKRREEEKNALLEQMRAIEDAAIARMSKEDQDAAAANDRPAVLREKFEKHATPEESKQYKELKESLERLQKRPQPPRELALAINHCKVKPDATHVLIRGNAHAEGKRVEPGFPEVLGAPDPVLPEPGPDATSSGRRILLANWIASPENPLTSRVMANRIWQHHFGKGIVASSSDFGKLGELPTHPELLDWLADEFVSGGWTLKRMHKLLMLSNTYRQSARARDDGLAKDPGNALYWRFSMRRLTAEEVRDSILSVTGSLNPQAGGPSVYPPIPREVLQGQSRPGEGWHTSPPDQANRRSVYVFVKRSLQLPIMAQHDQADTDSSCPVRYTTTVPTQSLGMLNSEFLQEQAAALAARLRKEAGGDLAAQVRRAIRLTTGREPTPEETAGDAGFVEKLRAQGMEPDKALTTYCLLILNANEFVYLD